jgi:predicted ATPase
MGRNRSEDTCLHQVVAQEGLRQHTQEPWAACCLNKAIMHSIQLDRDKEQYTKQMQSSEHWFDRAV